MAVASVLLPTSAGAQDGSGRNQHGAGGDAPGAEVSWGVAPIREPGGGAPRPNFVLAAEPGDTVDDAMTVSNLGDAALVLDVYASDAFNTSDGDTDLLPRGEEPVDLGAWLRPELDSVELAPGASIEVPFRIDVPDDAAPGDHVAGLVTSLVLDGGVDGEVAVERRLGVRVYLRVGGPLRPEITFRSLDVAYRSSWNPFAPGSMAVRYEVENTGNVRLRARRRAEAAGVLGATATAEGVDMPELLPGNTYELTQELVGVWPALGTEVQVTLEPYDPIAPSADRAPASAVARTTTTLWPVATVVALVVLVALLGAVGALARRRRAAPAEKISLPNTE